MNTSWEGLEEAVSIADAGTFVGGAALLNVSTSHLSRVIARLEQRLGAVLFNRTTRRVTMTETGRAFVDHGRRMIQEREELFAQANGLAEPQGELRLTCSVALGERFVAPIVRRFVEEHPRLSVTLDLSNRVIDLVGEGYDLAVRAGAIADKRLVVRQVASRTSELSASPDYIERHGRPRTVDDLERHQCLVGTNGSWTFHEAGLARIFEPKARLRCNSGAAIADAAVGGMGICQLPTFYVHDLLASGRLVSLLETCRPAAEPISVVYPQRRHLLPKVRKLTDQLAKMLPVALQGM